MIQVSVLTKYTNIPAWCKIFIWAIFNDITDIFIIYLVPASGNLLSKGWVHHPSDEQYSERYMRCRQLVKPLSHQGPDSMQKSIYQSLFLCLVILNVYFSTLVLHSVLSYAVSICLKKYLFIPLTVLITSTLHARSKYISGSGNLGNFVCFYKNQPRK